MLAAGLATTRRFDPPYDDSPRWKPRGVSFSRKCPQTQFRRNRRKLLAGKARSDFLRASRASYQGVCGTRRNHLAPFR